MLEAALVSELKKASSYHTLIDGRIYPLKLPQEITLPATVYQRINTTRYHCMQEDSKLSSPRIQLDHYSTSYITAKSVAEACRAKLQNFSGTIGAGAETKEGVAVLLQDETDHFEDDTKYWRVRQDYIIYHQED